MSTRKRLPSRPADERSCRGRQRKDASFPAPPAKSQLPESYAATVAEIKERIRTDRLRVVLGANEALVLLSVSVRTRDRAGPRRPHAALPAGTLRRLRPSSAGRYCWRSATATSTPIKLKADKLRVDQWRAKEATRDAVRVTIHDFLYRDETGLHSDDYTGADVETKTEEVFLHVYRPIRPYHPRTIPPVPWHKVMASQPC